MTFTECSSMEVYCSPCCMKNGQMQPFAIFLSTGDLYDVTFNDWRTKKIAKDLDEMVDLPLTFKITHIALRPFDHLDYRCCWGTSWVNLTRYQYWISSVPLYYSDYTTHAFHFKGIENQAYKWFIITVTKMLWFLGKCTAIRTKAYYLKVFYCVFHAKLLKLQHLANNSLSESKAFFHRCLCQTLTFYLIETFTLNFIRGKHVKHVWCF